MTSALASRVSLRTRLRFETRNLVRTLASAPGPGLPRDRVRSRLRSAARPLPHNDQKNSGGVVGLPLYGNGRDGAGQGQVKEGQFEEEI